MILIKQTSSYRETKKYYFNTGFDLAFENGHLHRSQRTDDRLDPAYFKIIRVVNLNSFRIVLYVR